MTRSLPPIVTAASTSRRGFLTLAGTALGVAGLAACTSKSTSATTGTSSVAASSSASSTEASSAGHIQSATAITKVYGDGQKLVAIAAEYDVAISTAKLTSSDFKVDSRTITKVYANTTAAMTTKPVNGRYVIIEMATTDSGAALWPSSLSTSANAGPPASGASGGSGMPTGAKPSGAPSGMPSGGAGGMGGGAMLKAAKATLRQTGAVTTTAGQTLAADATSVATSKVINLIVDDFTQATFTDPKTGASLKYNLFVPKDYDKTKTYPLVLFMHDATVTGTDPVAAIAQGLGAVVWASPTDQARQQAFVLAPLYSTQPVTDSFTTTNALDATVNLVDTLAAKYSIDTNRLYSTGQSGGAMLSMAIDIKYPKKFAATWVVAGQWDPTKVAPLAAKKMWITVAAGDAKAYPYENKIIPILAKDGATVSKAVWNGKAPIATLDADANALAAKGGNINYSIFTKGTVEPAGAVVDALNEHLCTWRVAYTIDAIRRWVFAQQL